jgi:3-oxoacyl-[acyl-carrier protein] reductase
VATAVVIGANSGIGAACVTAFRNSGWNVVATFHRRRDRLDDLLREATGHALVAMHVRVEDPQTIQSLREHLLAADQRIDALVVTASYNEPRLWNLDPLAVTADDLRAAFETEVIGLHNAVVELRPAMADGARIVAFSSASALHGDVDTFVYNVAKVGVASYVRMLAKRYGTDFRANCIAPDSIATDWLHDWNVSDEEMAGFRVLRGGLRRIGAAEEIASVVMFLCSGASDFMNGQTIVLDGGAG